MKMFDDTKTVNQKCPIQNKETTFIYAEEDGSKFLMCKECGYLITLKATEDYINKQNKMKQIREQEDLKNSSKPTVTCPYCQSTNTKKITNMSKAGSVALFGVFAMGKVSKQWHCNSCKSEF